MSKAMGKSGTGRGTDKKGWNRWQASANKAKSAKPYQMARHHLPEVHPVDEQQ